jgi:hypothetical protein
MFASGALAAMLIGSAACAGNSQTAGASAGDVLPSYDTYSNSALLHITSNYLGGVEVYTQAQSTPKYLGVATSLGATNLVLDEEDVPNPNLYLILQTTDGSQSKKFGPLQVKKGSVVDVRIPSSFRGALVLNH